MSLFAGVLDIEKSCYYIDVYLFKFKKTVAECSAAKMICDIMIVFSRLLHELQQSRVIPEDVGQHAPASPLHAACASHIASSEELCVL